MAATFFRGPVSGSGFSPGFSLSLKPTGFSLGFAVPVSAPVSSLVSAWFQHPGFMPLFQAWLPLAMPTPVC